MPYIVLDATTVREWIGEGSSTEHDAILMALENRLVSYLDRVTDHWFGGSKSFTDVINGDGTDKAWLKQRPLTVETIEYRSAGGLWQTMITGAPIPTTDVEVANNRQLILLQNSSPSTFAAGTQNIKVTYTGGYADPTTDVPEEVKQALLESVEDSFRTRLTTTPGFVVPDGASPLRPSTKIFRSVIARYKGIAGF